ncbi:PH, RCC1 and FYVE domains-containing protein 1 [Cornus florida]|uniref:PH, RCC1 and FYVE domains-containing protein 1 n=1 Tax=Cornus florida TaxID=4283 RepID=UPI00289FAE58|nr:PH, RCC1 and FYVE domains-containing protein 1 [Cornus florida]
MDEEFLETPSSDRALEQAIVALKKGAHLLKYGRRGKPKFCPFRLSTDEKFLIWYSGQDEKQLRLSLVTQIIRGQKTVNFQRQPQPERESQSFSLVYKNGERSLDLICKDKAEADSWFVGLRAVISRCHHPKSLGTLKIRRGALSCVNSPAGFTRRKHNLGLTEEITKYSQVHSVCGSPTQSLSQRCLSDGLSYSSNSFCLESSISTMQADVLFPNSTYIEPDDLKKRGAIYGGGEIQTNSLGRFVTPAHGSPQIDNNVLRDVLIWGEGIEGGCLGGGVDKFASHNGIELDAFSPKLIDSTMKLDVQKISLGARHAAIITKQGEVFCWGEEKGGRLGHKVNMDVTCPKIVDSLTGAHVKSVACGEYQTCAVTLSGELYTWGDSSGSDLNSGYRNRNQWIPQKLSGPLDGISISTVACGEWHMAIVSTTGQLFTYGDGTFGVLGHGNTQSISQPKEVESLKGLWVKSVACAPWHTAAIVEVMVERSKFKDPGGKMFTWGDGDKGRLGHANQERKLLPTCVAQLVDHDFVRVSCGRMLTVGLTNMGIVYTMGSAVHGQLGNPHAKDKSITIVQGKLKDEFVRDISSGSYHVAVYTSRGRVYSWGKGGNGQLGLGDNVDRDSPTLVEALRGRQVESITCGSNSTAAICLHKSISSIDQAACKGCSVSFGFTRKKHNCYNCGLSFCHACSSNKVANASLAPNKSKPFRVCDQCFNQLQRITHSVRVSKLESLSPRPLSTTYKALTDKKEDWGDANTKESQVMSTGKSCVEDKKCREGKTMKNQRENKQPLDLNSSLLLGLPRWGQVPCHELFKTDCREHTVAHVLRNQVSSLPPVCFQEIPLGSKCTSTPLNVEEGISESNKMLTEEVQKLRAEAASLEKLCQTRRQKIQECQQRIEETWSLAKEEAAKCKAAKDVIKALTLRLHTMSENISTVREVNGQVNASLPHVTSIHKESLAVKGVNRMFVATELPPEVGLPEDRRVGSLCSTPVMFSDKLQSTRDGDMYHAETTSAEESSGRRTQKKNGIKALNVEWVEQYEPGVYITFKTLPTGQKSLKRVRFSRKKFTNKEAERWWEEKQQEVYEKYDIE